MIRTGNLPRRCLMRPTVVAAAAAVALLAPLHARADPVSLIAIGANLGFTGTAALVAGAISAYGGYALIALNIYGAVDARRRARSAQRDATRRYNASVTDRSVTVLRSTPPWRVVYGECITGGDVLAIFTSDKPIISKGGAASVKPDGLKHLVITVATHEVQALGDVFIDGVPLGALDGNGFATGSDWLVANATDLATITFSNTTTIPIAATAIVSAVSLGDNYNTFDVVRTVAISGGGTTLTVTDGLGSGFVTVAYRVNTTAPAVIRIQKHLGGAAQTVDTYLNSVKPTEWDSSHRLRGVAYIVATLDLEDPRFQGGPPNITVRVTGKKLYDPRKDSTNGGSGSHRTSTPATWEWSANPALCVRDWITGEYGMAAAQADVVDSYTIAAANACDVTFSLTVDGVATVLKSYLCNGAATTEDGREKVLDDLADSMAGFAVYGAQWQIMAGAWSAPTMDLGDDDLDGQIEVVQAGAGIDELVNGIRGTYISASSASPGEFQPYQNATFLADDGADYWQDLGLPFTNTQAHCTNIARVLVERGRNSLTISYPAKLRAWPLQLGDRVRVTSAEYGYTLKTFRVTDWQFGLRSPVTLVLQEDAADAYDTTDAVVSDPTPNTDLPSPWSVQALSMNTPASGTAQLVQYGDGTINARVWVSWAAITGAYLRDGQGRVQVRWRRLGADADWQQVSTSADDLGLYLTGVVDGDRLVIDSRAINGLGFAGPSSVQTHAVVGKTQAADAVSGFGGVVSKGQLLWFWVPPVFADYGVTEVRSVNANWGSKINPPQWSGRASQWAETVTAAGSVTRYVRHIDTSGNPSTSSASATVTVAAGDTAGSWSGITGSGKPADNATVNRVTYSASAPSSPINGDVWIDTGGSPAVIRLRVAGIWQAGANLSTGDLAQLNTVGTQNINLNAVTDGGTFLSSVAGGAYGFSSGGGLIIGGDGIRFTPADDCIIEVTCSFEALSSGTAWDAARNAAPFAARWADTSSGFGFTVDANNKRGDGQPLSTSRSSYTLKSRFAVVASTDYLFGLCHQNNPAGVTINYWNLRTSISVFYR